MQLEKSLRKRNSLILTETSCGDKEERQGKMRFSLVAAHPKPSINISFHVNSVNHTKCHVNEQHRAVSGRL